MRAIVPSQMDRFPNLQFVWSLVQIFVQISSIRLQRSHPSKPIFFLLSEKPCSKRYSVDTKLIPPTHLHTYRLLFSASIQSRGYCNTRREAIRAGMGLQTSEHRRVDLVSNVIWNE